MSDSNKIYSTRCWIDGELQPATIVIEEGLIKNIVSFKITGAEDLGNCVIMPGVIDAHVHVNEPGRTEWEGFDTATQAAAAGGTTTIVDMPLNASPVTTTLEAFHEKLESSKNKLHVNVGFYAGLIPGNTNELPALINAGVMGVKCFLVHSGIDEFPNVTEIDLAEAMPLIAAYHIPLLVHCEMYDTEIKNDFDENSCSYRHYLQSRPKQWENDAIGLMISLCRKFNCDTHIVHVSSAEALDAIASAKKDKLPLTAETCTQYIYFNAEKIPDADCRFKCAPPIRELENNILLKQALAVGILDFVATDHSPAPESLKEIESGNLQKAWGGIAGIQFLLQGSWTALKETMLLEKFIPLLTENPAKFLKVDKRKGFIKEGYDADLVVWSPEEKELIKEEDILFRHKISPYIGETVFGTIQQTFVNGIPVYKQKKIINKNSGTWLLRK